MAEDSADKVALVAEDEVLIRNLVSYLLRSDDFAVLTAADGEEALHISRSYKGDIHLLLTDYKMPNMNGVELIDCIRRERPETRVLIMSGHTSGLIATQELGCEFLRKPFVPVALREKIRELLANPPEDPQEF